MILMEKNGVKRYVPDVAIGGYRALGWRGVGEPEIVVVEKTIDEPEVEPVDDIDEDVPDEKFVCDLCGREFGSKAALTKHIKKEHAGE